MNRGNIKHILIGLHIRIRIIIHFLIYTDISIYTHVFHNSYKSTYFNTSFKNIFRIHVYVKTNVILLFRHISIQKDTYIYYSTQIYSWVFCIHRYIYLQNVYTNCLQKILLQIPILIHIHICFRTYTNAIHIGYTKHWCFSNELTERRYINFSKVLLSTYV